MEQKASIWDQMANEQTDPEAYRMYKNYADDLRNQTDYLMKYGLNANSRRGMMNLKSRYNKEIVPIENAYRRREELAKEQRDALNANPSMFYQRDMTTTSLDDFIKNPSLDYGKKYSGALLAQQVGQMAASLKSQLTGRSKMKGIGLPYQYEQLLQYGYTPEQIWQTINNPKEGNPILNTIVEQALDASGMKEWASPTQLAQARAYANEGLYNAIGKTDVKNFTDSFSMQTALARGAEEREAERRKQNQLNSLAINPLNIYSSRKLKEEETDYKNNLQKYSKYFYKDKDGRIKMSYEGFKEYNKSSTMPIYQDDGSYVMHTTYTGFRIFMDKLGAKQYMKDGSRPLYTLGNLWNKYVADSPESKTSKYDATKVTEFDYTIAGSQQGDMKDAIMTANRGMSLKEVDYNNKTKQFEDTNEEITMEDLKNDKYKVTATRFSPYGSTVMIQDDKGRVRRFRLPYGINTTNEQNRDRAMTAAYQWQQTINTGRYTDAEGKEHQATPEEIAYAQDQYEKAIQQAYLFHSQLGVQNKTKEQEYQPYGY